MEEDFPLPIYAEIDELLDGWIGWIGVALVIIGWNGHTMRAAKRNPTRHHELLSEFAHRHRTGFVAFAIYQAMHFSHWPNWFRRIDPLHQLAERLK